MMSRWLIAVLAVFLALLLFPFVHLLSNKSPAGQVQVGITTPLHSAAASGENGPNERLLNDGADIKAVDEYGRTPLHLAADHGHPYTALLLLERGADANAVDVFGKQAVEYALVNGHTQTAAAIRPYTTAPTRHEAPTSTEETPQRLNPALRYSDLATFEAAIGQPACLLKSPHIYLFAPKYREEAANTVLPYLSKAYDALRAIVGIDTKYIIVVYNFTPGHEEAFGGTGDCAIYYDDKNLDLARQEEWNRSKIPHVSGYIEEMAHNFVSATNTQFGWEMMGWSIGQAVCTSVAGNPVIAHSLQSTRQEQADTFRRYRELGFVLPADVEPNTVDRIHAYLLWECEQQYGPGFWKDFFKEVRKERLALLEATGDRDRRY